MKTYKVTLRHKPSTKKVGDNMEIGGITEPVEVSLRLNREEYECLYNFYNALPEGERQGEQAVYNFIHCFCCTEHHRRKICNDLPILSVGIEIEGL